MISPITEFKVDKLNVIVFENRADMGVAAYELYKKFMLQTLKEKATARAIFAAAHSQSDFLGAMAADKAFDFGKVEAFHMDEYLGLNSEAPQNFGNFLKKYIFSKQTFRNVHYLKSDTADAAAECSRYEALLRQAPVDIVSLGIGENGHIAFNDPHEADFNDSRWVRVASLDTVCRQQQVNDGEFANLPDVPERALTLTIPALMACKFAVAIVPNERKADAVNLTVIGPITESCPASILRTHENAYLFLDKDSARYIL